jgi:polyferredoxin
MYKGIEKLGLIIFFVGLVIFTYVPFVGSFQIDSTQVKNVLSEKENELIGQRIQEEIAGIEFHSSYALGRSLIHIYEAKNDELKKAEKWDEVMWTEPSAFAFKIVQKVNQSAPHQHANLYFLLTFGFCIIGGLMYILPGVVTLGPAGIKNDGVYHDASTNRGWIGIVAFSYLVTFYIVLYFHPYILVNQIALTQPVKNIFVNELPSQWFLYGLMYTVVMVVMGVKMLIKYRHSKYQIVRTITVVLFQVIFAFLLVEIMPLFNLPSVDLKNAWPLDYSFLFDWNVTRLFEAGNLGKFMFVWGIVLSLILIPTLTYFYGKRFYCSWVCGCGGLAETLGDPYRHLSNKTIKAWKFERFSIHGVLVFAVVMTVFAGYHTYNEFNHPEMDGKATLLGISSYDVRNYYSFLIGSIFAGVIGTGFYPILGNRVWCRFGCPLAAYMGLIQRFKSRFRITTNGGQCISCGNCSTYCEQGIDVRAYAQKGQNIVRSSCVGCGICSEVCPRGVLKLENGPEEGRINDNPIIIGRDGEIRLNK